MAIALGSILINDMAVGSSAATAIMLGNAEVWTATEPNTKVTYADSSVSSFSIEGEFSSESVPNKETIVGIDFGSKVTSIGISALADCAQLSAITMSKTITSVGASAFANTDVQTLQVLPEVSSIGENAFADTSLTSLVFKGRSPVEVQAMSNYSWGVDASVISAELLPQFYIEAIDAGSTVHFQKNTALTTVSFQYSTDNCTTWTDYTWTPNRTTDVGATVTLTNVGDRVYFKAANRNISLSNGSSVTYVVGTGKLKAGGSVMWLLDGRGLQTNLLTSGVYQNDYAFMGLFGNCTSLYDASDLLLPSNVATTYCYAYMFQNCSSLAQSPALPATTLAYSCYRYMFDDCTSLVAAPELPATALADYCYTFMFYGCSRLASINVSFSAWSPSNATIAWLYNAGTAATGTKTFTCPAALGTDETITRGDNACPEGWTVVNV